MNILVTGAGGIIGSAIVEDLLLNGNNLILCDIKKNNFINKVENKYKNQIYFKKTDITKFNNLKKLLEEGKRKYKIIHGAIHCAYPRSKNFGVKFEKLKTKDLNYDLIHQLGSTIIFSQQIVKLFRKQNYGNLILISSIMGVKAPDFEVYRGTKMNSPIEYSAIKSGVISIVKYLAKYLKNENIKINCLSPGGIIGNQSKIFKKNYKKKCISKGLLSAKDLCPSIRFLLSEKSKFMNGQNLIIDDGWSL